MALDVKGKLKLMRMNSSQARALFDHLLSFKNFRREMPVASLAKKSGLSEKEVREILQLLERLKLGRLWLGRQRKTNCFYLHNPGFYGKYYQSFYSNGHHEAG